MRTMCGLSSMSCPVEMTKLENSIIRTLLLLVMNNSNKWNVIAGGVLWFYNIHR